MDYYRVLEYSVASSMLSPNVNDKILDVGSLNSIFPIYLALKGAKVYAIDIVEKVMELKIPALKLSLSNLLPAIMDATGLNYPSNFFSKVSAISTIEHILPLRDGDTKAMKEIARVLKPKGIAIVTVPYENRFSKEWRCHSVHGKYLMRHYDEDSIYSRLIDPSKLSPIKILYFCDDIGFYKLWYKYFVYMLSPISWFFSKLFLKIREEPDNAKGIIMLLKKR